jgi:hypothetical protein
MCAQGLYASLELLPMWAGIEPDVQLFASGCVLDDDGEWAGGQSLGGGNGDGNGGSGGARQLRQPLSLLANSLACSMVKSPACKTSRPTSSSCTM